MQEGEELSKPKNNLLANIILTGIVVFFIGFLGGVAGNRYSNLAGTSGGLQKNVVVQEQSAVIDVVKKTEESVVSITSEQSRLDFFGRIRKSQSAGTGFIVTAEGLIMTNKHVVDQEGATYSVFTADGKEYKGKVVAKDASYDIAFIKIEAKNLKPIELGDSNKVEVGQKVIAIGNALGQFQNTVTTGVVSAVGRAIEAGDGAGQTEVLENLIQTDAAINHGNSGGPLLNIDGQAIGINTAVSANGEGIGFAIPINIAKSALKSVTEKGKITRPMLGIRYVNVTKEFASRNSLPVNRGALIYASNGEVSVLPGSPAARSGLKDGDIIIKVNEEEIAEGKSLATILSGFSVGEKVSITYVRDKNEHSVSATLTETGS